MRKYFVLFLCITTLLLALVGCGGGGSHKNNDVSDVDLINTLLDNYQTAYLQSNLENYISLLAFPFTIKDSDGDIVIEDITEARESLTFEDLTYQTFSVSSRTINVDGDSATVNATVNYHVTDASDSSVDEGTDVVVISCIKVDGSWKMSGETFVTESPDKSLNLKHP